MKILFESKISYAQKEGCLYLWNSMAYSIVWNRPSMALHDIVWKVASNFATW